MILSQSRLLLICLVLGVVWSPLASGEPYIFESLIDSSGTFSYMDTVSLNNAGAVSFYGRLDSGKEGVYRLDQGGSLVTIADTFDTTFFSFHPNMPRLAENGTVAFLSRIGSSGSVSVIYSGNGSPLTEIARSNVDNFTSFGALEVNSAGRVVFRGTQNGTAGIYTSDGGAVTPLVTELDGLDTFGNPDINENGLAAVWTDRNIGPRVIWAVDAAAGSPRQNYVQDGDPGLSSVNALGDDIKLNENGEVLFYALGAGFSGTAHFVDSGPATPPVRHTQLNRPTPGAKELSINNSGDIVFFNRHSDTGDDGIWDGNETTPEVIISEGDPLFGSTITYLNFENAGFNDHKQIAFSYQLADGLYGVALGSIVPEPSQLALLGSLAAVLLAALARRRLLVR